MRRKEYAVSLGLATEGRGRMSREAHAAIDKARAEGMVFDDDAPVTPKAQPKVEVKKDVSPRVPIVADAPQHVMGLTMRYPLDKVFKVTDSKGKTHKVNARAICFNTRVSLAGCPCNEHRTLLPSMEVATIN